MKRNVNDGLPKVGYWSHCERWVYVTFPGMSQPRPFRVENDEIRHDGKAYRVGACHCFPIGDVKVLNPQGTAT